MAIDPMIEFFLLLPKFFGQDPKTLITNFWSLSITKLGD